MDSLKVVVKIAPTVSFVICTRFNCQVFLTEFDGRHFILGVILCGYSQGIFHDTGLNQLNHSSRKFLVEYAVEQGAHLIELFHQGHVLEYKGSVLDDNKGLVQFLEAEDPTVLKRVPDTGLHPGNTVCLFTDLESSSPYFFPVNIHF